MVGRALRGKKAEGGEGKEKANIVLFMDQWKRLLPFICSNGGRENIRSAGQRKKPYDLISIHLVKHAAADI